MSKLSNCSILIVRTIEWLKVKKKYIYLKQSLILAKKTFEKNKFKELKFESFCKISMAIFI